MTSSLPPADLPPVLGPTADVHPRPAAGPARWRTGLALVILALYVVFPAIAGAGHEGGDAALLPPSIRGVLILSATELALFSVAFATAVGLGRLGADDLRLRGRGGWWIWPRAIAWSVALRLVVGVLLAAALTGAQLVRGQPLADLEGVRPKVEAMVDVAALGNPLYLFLMLTLVSFVLAGLREELWRAGMIALLGALKPGWFGGRLGPWLALVPVAVLFGLGHTPQGWVGVAATVILGLGLGAILLHRRSTWEAVLAHGFFNATTFAALPLLARYLPDLTG